VFLDLLDDIELIPPRRAAVVLIDQLVRSLGSVGANVAEGFNRSRAKYLASLDIARGEANEAENWLYKLRDGGFLPPERASAHLRDLLQVQKRLAALRRSIAARPERKKP
jgi:four helix bundle protein